LSGFRLLLGFVLYFLIKQELAVGAILLGLLAIISDYADGYFARKRNETSELGKILDPLADKFTVGLGSIALHQTFGLPLWIVCVVIGRDLLIVFGSLILMQKVQRVVASEMPGKVAVTVISLLLLSFLFRFVVFQEPLLYLTALAVAVSFFYYILKFVRLLKSEHSGKDVKI